jgi:DNA (cytosine-5)-methyltransferase 1
MRLNDFFCGAGGMGRGFKNAGFDIVGAWDWKQEIVDSYAAHLGNHVKLQDIKKLTGKEVPNAETWAFGFPCQDLSRSGKMKGLTVKCADCETIFERNEEQKNCPKCGCEEYRAESRSGMFFEIMRLLREVSHKPEVLIAENVQDLRKSIDVLQEEYDKHGYKTYYKLLNSKFWGVPHNRPRYFVIGVRKDLEMDFVFPEEPTEITTRIVDILEEEVDEKFFNLTENVMSLLSIAPEGLRVRQATRLGYDVARIGDVINVAHPNSKTRRGRVGKQIAQTILTSPEQVVWLPDGRLRYLTPREAARCQGFKDDEFPQVVTDSQMYFQMGNAVTVNVAKVLATEIKKQILERRGRGF